MPQASGRGEREDGQEEEEEVFKAEVEEGDLAGSEGAVVQEEGEEEGGGKSKSSRSGRNRHDDSSGRADGAPRLP